jgi:hypothetical protein
MDALHFRRRAEQARELARDGEDMRLTQLLLALADDMDAEAEAMDADEERSHATSTSTLTRPRGQTGIVR